MQMGPDDYSNREMMAALIDFRDGVAAKFDQVDQRFASMHAEMNRRFDQVYDRLDRVDERFDRVDERFDRVDERFDRVDERFDRLEARVAKLEPKRKRRPDRE